MSLKRSVLLLSAIFGIVGIGVSVIIIAIGGGFSGTGSSMLDPPDESDLWTVGEAPVNSFSLQYLMTSRALEDLPYNATVWLNFTRLKTTDWNVSLSIYDGSHNDEFFDSAIAKSVKSNWTGRKGRYGLAELFG